MSNELKRAIIYERELDSLELNSTISRLQDIDCRQRALVNLLSRNSPYQPARSQDLPRFNQSQTLTQGDPMDLSSAETRGRGPLPKDEKERRRKLGLCNYCGEKGHLVKTCPNRPQQLSRSVETIEEDGSGDSGNAQAL